MRKCLRKSMWKSSDLCVDRITRSFQHPMNENESKSKLCVCIFLWLFSLEQQTCNFNQWWRGKLQHVFETISIRYVIYISFYFLSAFLFADWEYGTTKEAWDIRPSVETITALNAINSDPNTIAFHWTFMFGIGDLIKAKMELGWDKKKMMQWTVIQAFKRDNRVPRQLSFNRSVQYLPGLSTYFRITF